MSEWSEWVMKWCKKGPLFFLKLIYMIDHVYTYNPISIKIVRQLSYRFKSLQTFGDPTKKIKITISTWFFKNHAESLKQGRGEASRPSLARAAPVSCCALAALIGPQCRHPTLLGRASEASLVVKWSEVKSESEVIQNRSFIYPETYRYHRSYVYL